MVLKTFSVPLSLGSYSFIVKDSLSVGKATICEKKTTNKLSYTKNAHAL